VDLTPEDVEDDGGPDPEVEAEEEHDFDDMEDEVPYTLNPQP
jgi:hypothetical protein